MSISLYEHLMQVYTSYIFKDWTGESLTCAKCEMCTYTPTDFSQYQYHDAHDKNNYTANLLMTVYLGDSKKKVT